MPARKRTAAGPTPVEAITHADKRANLPTSDASDFVDPEIDQPIPVRYPRDPTLDPQLVWKGKDALDGEDLVADAPAIYIQEKIDPRVIVENLRNTAAQPKDEPELTLFDTFDGLCDLDLVDFYRHQANWSNRMILGDSLNVMASLAERERLRGKVQMIYVDPPYGIKFGSNWQVSARKRDVKDGKLEDATREVEQIKAFRDTWEYGISSYLTYLRDRLTVAKELLAESGSVFVQIGDENVHLVRSLMDEIFGADNFCGQITFMTTTGAGSPAVTTEVLAGVNDYLLWYARDRACLKYRTLYFERSVGNDPNYRYVNEGGTIRALSLDELKKVDTLHESGAQILRANPLTSQTGGPTTIFPVELGGRTYIPGKGGWKTNVVGMERLKLADRLMGGGRTLSFVRYFADFPFQAYSTGN